MPSFKILPTHKPSDIDGKHIVVNCTTGEIFASDTLDEATALAAQHDVDAKAAHNQGKGGPHGNG